MKKVAKNVGFSLIELMVVISIISLLAAISLPKIGTLKIKAARTEIYTNLHAIQSLVEAYHAENSVYPIGSGLAGAYRSPGGMGGGIVVSSYCTTPNQIGFRASNCEQLRYVYRLLTGVVCARCSIAGDGARLKMFTIDATSSYWEMGSSWYATGSSPATNLCKKPTGYSVYYMDAWEMRETGELIPFGGNDSYDALKNCF